jgi:hypothetical protein
MLLISYAADAFGAQSPYIVIKLSNNPSYNSAYGRVNKQLTVLQLKRTGSARRAKCRDADAIGWLAEQGKETAGWKVAASEKRRNDALAAELSAELAAQDTLQAC